MDPKDSPVLLVGTMNRNKLAEIAAILGDLPVRILGAQALGSTVDAPETGSTFEENARQKAIHFARAAARVPPPDRPRWVISDDSGLCVDALGGAPGVRSARYAGAGHSDARNNEKLLAALAGVPAGRRGAAFVCAIACASVPEREVEHEILFEVRGECRGRIAESPRGQGGFGYDPLFFLPELGRTYSELSGEEKNRISHRGRALIRFSALFRAILDGALAKGTGR